MKKIFVSLMVLALIFVSAGIVFAHPPKNIDVAWNRSTETLTVSSAHVVNDPEKHYILTLTVFENNKQLLLKQYTRQGTADKFSDSVILKGLTPGAKIRIQLVCNIMGSRETEFTVQ